MDQPLISIITATYNNDKTLDDTINSIAKQTYDHIEYIVIDGNSSDETINILKLAEDKFKKRNFKFNWISEPDNGIYHAWNKALDLVCGDWIVFIGADDYLKNNRIIEIMYPALVGAENKNIKYVYAKIEHINENNKLIETSGKPWKTQKKRFTYIMNVGHTGSFHHKSLFLKHGKFDESFQIAGDYEFLLREFKAPCNRAFFVDNVAIVMREGGISANLENRPLLIRETQRARKLNGITSFSRELFIWNLRVKFIIGIKHVFGENVARKSADYYRLILGKNKRWSI